MTLIASSLPFEDPAGGPNFYRFGDNVVYEIKIDNNGNGVEDISYQFRFTSQTVNPNTFLYATGPVTALDDPNRNLFQTHTVTRVENGRAVSTLGPMRTMYDNVGPASTPNYGGNGSASTNSSRRMARRGKCSPARPTTRSSWTCACSTSSTAATCRKRAPTAWPASTCIASRGKCRGVRCA